MCCADRTWCSENGTYINALCSKLCFHRCNVTLILSQQEMESFTFSLLFGLALWYILDNKKQQKWFCVIWVALDLQLLPLLPGTLTLRTHLPWTKAQVGHLQSHMDKVKEDLAFQLSPPSHQTHKSPQQLSGYNLIRDTSNCHMEEKTHPAELWLNFLPQNNEQIKWLFC